MYKFKSFAFHFLYTVMQIGNIGRQNSNVYTKEKIKTIQFCNEIILIELKPLNIGHNRCWSWDLLFPN